MKSIDKLKKQKNNKILRLFLSKFFLINFFGSIVIVIILTILINFILKIYTNHGETVSVPNLIGIDAEEAINIIEENGFKYQIIDTIFDLKQKKGAIADQDPKPESLVKKGRRIYLILNSRQDELISMPQLTGLTLRQAKNTAQNYGLVIGNLKYVPDIAVNVVIKQLYKGNEIEPGKKIKKGSKIDLIIGLGLSDETTSIPSVIGMTYTEASNMLLDMYLNIGAVVYDNTVKTHKDSIKAKIYRQNPTPNTIKEMNLGYNIDIWLTMDKDLIKEALSESSENDN